MIECILNHQDRPINKNLPIKKIISTENLKERAGEILFERQSIQNQVGDIFGDTSAVVSHLTDF